jgi:hypothetical protein
MDTAVEVAENADAFSAKGFSALTLVCGLRVEERAAVRGGSRAFRVGLGAPGPLPDGPLVSFGLAGALVPGFEPGTLLTARKLVGPDGETLWEGPPLPVPGALAAVLCSTGEVVDEPDARRLLAERTSAVAVDMESAALANTGRLAGVVRAVSDTPARPVGRLASAATADGGTDWAVVARSAVAEPVATARTAHGATRALASLRRAAAALAPEAPGA